MLGTSPAVSEAAPGVMRLHLCRPARGNALTSADLALMSGHLDAIEATASANVLIVSAAGRFFCTGFDFASLAAELESKATAGAFERFADRLARTRVVTIAALNGPAMGGGTDIALACDLRMGTADASMDMPAARFGLPLYPGAIARYVASFGIDRAKRMILGGRKHEASELQTLGVLAELVHPEDLEPQVAAWASEIAGMPASAMAAMKAAINSAAIGHGVGDEAEEAILRVLTADAEAILARIARIRSAAHAR